MKWMLLLVLPLLLISLIVGVWVVLSHYGLPFADLNRSEYGEMGDYFGGILNPFFALLSFMALLGTIILQVKELEDQRKELRQSREAQEGSAKELKLQNQLQFHAIRVNAMSALINAAMEDAKNSPSLDHVTKNKILDLRLEYINSLSDELKAIASLSPEGMQRIGDARNARNDWYARNAESTDSKQN